MFSKHVDNIEMYTLNWKFKILGILNYLICLPKKLEVSLLCEVN